MIGRWLLGFCFSKHDMALLDDPIPDRLYCKPCRQQKDKLPPPGDMPPDMEACESVDTMGSSTQCSAQDVVVTSEPTPHLDPNDSFNITREVDKCYLWKNMVRSLDAPLPSPTTRVAFNHGASAAKGVDATVSAPTTRSHSEGTWHPVVTMDTNRVLCTVEECDTDLESTTQLADHESITSPLTFSVPPSLPLQAVSGGKKWRHSSTNARLPCQSTGAPQYQSTAV